jgi:hypothetical protein
MMIVALTCFVGIFAPVSAIWTNAPFYAWSAALTEKPKSEQLAARLVPALEKTGCSSYFGALMFVAAGVGLTRFIGTRKQPIIPVGAKPAATLAVMEVVFGVAAGGCGFFWSIFRGSLDWFHVLGIGSGSLLLALAFRRLRLEQWRLRFGSSSQSEAMSRFAIHCGLLIAVVCELCLQGLILTGIGENELARAGSFPTPFAYTVVALNSLSPVGFMPTMILAPFGGLPVGFCLTRAETFWRRVAAVAQGGAAASAVGFVFIWQLALSLAICCVPLIPGLPRTSSWLMLDTQRLFSTAGWLQLAGIYVGLFAGAAIMGAFLWGIEAMIPAAFSTRPPPLPPPAKSPPPALNV